MKRWPILLMVGAIAFELLGTTALKLSNGGARPLWYAVVAVGYCIAFYLFSLALRSMALGVAYAMWAGLGIIGTAVIGSALFRQHLSWTNIAGIVVILIGVGLLNLGVNDLSVAH